MSSSSHVDRRQFLKSGALLGSGLVISFMLPASARELARRGAGKPGLYFAPNAFLRVGVDDSINITLSHVEMGQGVWTTLSMLIAEELDADWKNISIEHSPAGKSYVHTAYGLQITGGSSSTWSEFDRYRQAGATARVLLIQAAAQKFGVSPGDCKTENGMVICGSQKASYGELAMAAAALPAPTNVTLRTPDQWKYIGKGVKRLDAPDKVNGNAKYGIDVHFPGLLTAVVAHAPVIGGKVISFDASATKAVAGVRDVVQVPTGVAVIADHFWAAKKGRDALKITWDDSPNASLNSVAQFAQYKKLADEKGAAALEKGNVDNGLSQAAKIIEAEYSLPYLAHAPMEPINCTVKISDGKCEIWTGTQMPGVDQAAAAKILGLANEQVSIITPYLGGGFGRRATPTSDFVSEAVEIAKASGKAIKMIWTREDDMRAAYYRPAFLHRLRVGVSKDGYPVAWKQTIVGQSITAGTPFASGKPIDDSSVEGVNDSPYMSEVADAYVGLHSPTLPVHVLWYRSVGHTHTGYVMETFIDRLATTAGKDPVEYRRTLLKNHKRHLATLNLAAEKANWGKPLPKGHYHGVAVHEAFRSFVAQVAEISLDERGRLKIHKVTCAVDCGLAVNPDGVRAQMESGIVFGITMALYGEITIDKGMVQQSNFHDYRIARMNESPVIDVHIVPSTDQMGGAGEPCVPPTAPAIANALFAATGKRLTNLPLGTIHTKQA
ncbi:MAG TPA: xanthine dehydrogenase family protein molybdopterin-binding subunit [Chitinophagaceae bacterium]|nr:xanthine dehydrogenase family protein molybdopterin-binding subunit [Chitinophagaceae bacterium]